MKIVHLYRTHKEARKGYESFLQSSPERFLPSRMEGLLNGNRHRFIGMGIFSNYEKLREFLPERIHLYFMPNPREMAGIKAYSRTPSENIHCYPKGEFHAC